MSGRCRVRMISPSRQKGNSRDCRKRVRRIFAQRAGEFDDGVFAFAVRDDIHEAGLQNLRADVAEETAAGDNFGVEAFCKAREAETFGAAHSLLAHRDDGGTARADFAPPACASPFRARARRGFPRASRDCAGATSLPSRQMRAVAKKTRRGH